MNLAEVMAPVLNGQLVESTFNIPNTLDELLPPGEEVHPKPIAGTTYHLQLFFKHGLFWLRFSLNEDTKIYWDCSLSWDDMVHGLSIFSLFNIWQITEKELPPVPIEQGFTDSVY